MRKIIQITSSSEMIIALCSDGTVWRWWSAEIGWRQVDTSQIENANATP
jgi:hypothetical protein